MGQYIDIGAVKTWYDQQGEGDPLVLLHGGLVPNESWGMQMPEFSARFEVLAPERRAKFCAWSSSYGLAEQSAG